MATDLIREHQRPASPKTRPPRRFRDRMGAYSVQKCSTSVAEILSTKRRGKMKRSEGVDCQIALR
jgi:hypothetical protein